MEPDRFDDVEFRILEGPEPPPRPPRRPRRRRRRSVFAIAVTALTAGALAASASALTDRAEAPASKKLSRGQERAWSELGRHECHRGKGHRGGADAGFDSSFRY
jgi:hypothetical protein